MNILFDFGLTLVDFAPSRIVKSYGIAGDDAKTMADVFFARKYFDKLDSGEMDKEAHLKEVLNELPKHLHNYAKLMSDNWIFNLPVIEGMDNLITKLKNDGHKIYLISNISSYMEDIYKDIWILRNFDGYVFSGVVKMHKPNADIFKYAIEKFGIKAKDCIFIDDNKENINTAKSLGIASFLFDGNAEHAEEFIYNNI